MTTATPSGTATPTTSSEPAQRRPGVGPLAGWRGEDGDKHGRGEANPNQLEKYIENGGFSIVHMPEEAQFYKHVEQGLPGLGDRDRIYRRAAIHLQALSRAAAQAPARRRGQGDQASRPTITASGSAPWIRCQSGTNPFTRTPRHRRVHPLHAITQRPMHMYHSWGTQNAWLRQIHRRERAVCADQCLGPGARPCEEGDWALVTSAHPAKSGCRSRTMDALNGTTLWTWNAIGKRKGAWALDKDAPEATEGFLLNHLIDELLPPKGDGRRWANSDPITGQAAWFDLRVKSAEIQTSPNRVNPARSSHRAKQPGGQGSQAKSRAGDPDDQDASANRKTPRPRHRSRHLRRLPCLRGQLQGMEHPRVRRSPTSTPMAPIRRAPGSTGSTPSNVTPGQRAGADRALPQILPALRRRALRDRLPDGRQPQARPRTASFWSPKTVHRLRAVRLGLPLRRARDGPGRKRHEEMHALRRPDLQRDPARGRP
jgi:hypothetical protein